MASGLNAAPSVSGSDLELMDNLLLVEVVEEELVSVASGKRHAAVLGEPEIVLGLSRCGEFAELLTRSEIRSDRLPSSFVE